jgi:hypothetical protein
MPVCDAFFFFFFFKFQIRIETFHRFVDLSYNTGLRTIHIDRFIDVDCIWVASHHDWIPLILARARCLREIELDVTLNEVQQLEKEAAVDWEAYDRLLAGEDEQEREEGGVTTVLFRVKGEVVGERVEVERKVMELMPRCREKGILSFAYDVVDTS